MTFSPKYQSDPAARPAGQAVAWLRSGAASFEPLLASHEVCAYRMSPDGALLAASPALARLLGYAGPAELCARRPEAGEYDAAYAEALFARHGGLIDAAESEWRRSDGTLLRVYESARASYGPAARPEFYDGVITPIDAPAMLPMPYHVPAAPPAALPRSNAMPVMAARPPISDEGGTSSLALRQYALIVWRWLWLIMLCALLAGGAGYALSVNTVPVYQSATSLLINQARTGNGSSDYNALLTSERLAKTYAELMTKRPLLEAVIANLQLATDAESLARRVSVAPVVNTQLLNLAVEDTDPRRAADIANTIVKVFVEQNQALQNSRYTDTRQSLERELAKVQLDIDSTQAALGALKSPPSAADEAERERLQTLLAQYRGSYATLLKSLGDVQLAEAQNSDTLSVAEAARPELAPVRPQMLRNTLLAAIVGVLLALGLAFLIEFLDDRVKSAGQAAKLAGAVALGAVGRFPKEAAQSQLVTLSLPNSPLAEAYRMLRVNLDFAAIDSPLRAVTVTSANPSEGKSTTIANLAVALAEAGKQVILVDTDLRRPTLHKVFGLTNERGVTTALLNPGAASLAEQLLPTEVAGLRLLACGPIPPNPAELLSSRRMAELVEALKGMAEIVLFDTPPLLVFADAALLARACDGTILVARARTTRAGALRQARAQLYQAGIRLLGVVLNGVATPRGGNYSYYYYYGEREQRRGWLGRFMPFNRRARERRRSAAEVLTRPALPHGTVAQEEAKQTALI